MTNSVTTSRQRPDIQGLRAIAVTVVVLFHAGLPLPGGFIGVDVFFAISGFVITAMLYRDWERSNTVNFTKFYVRRIKRLTPALMVMIAVTLTASLFILSPLGPLQVATETGVGAIAFAANFVIKATTGGYFDDAATTNPLLHTWSLSVEEQFYFIYPALLLFGWLVAKRFTRLNWFPLAWIGLISVISFGGAWISSVGGLGPRTEWLLGFYGPFSRIWEFAAGSLLALVWTKLSWIKRPQATIFGLVGSGVLIYALFGITQSTPYPGPMTLLPIIATLLLITAGAASSNPVSKLLGATLMRYVGDRSYSWYLWHWPLIVFSAILWPNKPLVVALVAFLSFLPATISYKFIEQPLRQREFKSLKTTSFAMGGFIIGTLAVAILILTATNNGFWDKKISNLQQARSLHSGVAACLSADLSLINLPTECALNSNASGAPIYLVGDSNAIHFSESTIAAGLKTNRPVYLITAPGCPFVKTKSNGKNSEDSSCTNFVKRITDQLNSARKGDVIYSVSDQYWTTDPVTGQPFTKAKLDSNLRRYGLDLDSTLNALLATGNKVVLVNPVPHFNGNYSWDPATCSVVAILKYECYQSMPMPYVDSVQGGFVQVQDSITRQLGITSINPRPHLCQQAKCETSKDNVQLYADADHISVKAAAQLANLFESSISSNSTIRK